MCPDEVPRLDRAALLDTRARRRLAVDLMDAMVGMWVDGEDEGQSKPG